MEQRRAARGPVVTLTTVVLATVGLVVRAAPLLDPTGRGLTQFPSEDGYLMLTIARNIALGHGMSIAAGTIPTNGTQPLMAYVYAVPFSLVGGDKVWGVFGVQVLEIVIAGLAAILLYAVARRLLEGEPQRDPVAALAAAVWFASPITVRHSMNGLESGAYALAVLAVAHLVLRLPSEGRPWPLRRCVGLGALLGVAFWVRNDASLLIAAVCLARVAPAFARGAQALWERGLEAFAVGATSLAVGAPWLVSNQLRFGHVMPISGLAESSNIVHGQNLVGLPAVLAEYVMVTFPIPSTLEERPFVIAASCAVAVAGLVAAVALARRLGPPARAWLGILGLWTAFFVVFYGWFFGVGFFLTRYFFPISPFVAVVSVYWAWRALEPLSARLRIALPAAAAVLVLVTAGLGARLWVEGTNQGFFQIVDWVHDHVPDDVWVGAVQTGTLGFFHDRTINLDGKVNPYALQARLEHRTQDYVLESPIQYLVDWVGIETWLHGTPLEGRFDLAVFDRDRNLVVLRRRATAPASQPAT
jgi:hypothetical protein